MKRKRDSEKTQDAANQKGQESGKKLDLQKFFKAPDQFSTQDFVS